MSDSAKYTPLADRLQQDVWHDNFVPKYSALASARPSKLVLIGVWLIFAPMAVGSIAVGISTLLSGPDLVSRIAMFLLQGFMAVLAVAILITQTQRYRRAILEDDGERDDEEPADSTAEPASRRDE